MGDGPPSAAPGNPSGPLGATFLAREADIRDGLASSRGLRFQARPQPPPLAKQNPPDEGTVLLVGEPGFPSVAPYAFPVVSAAPSHSGDTWAKTKVISTCPSRARPRPSRASSSPGLQPRQRRTPPR